LSTKTDSTPGDHFVNIKIKNCQNIGDILEINAKSNHSITFQEKNSLIYIFAANWSKVVFGSEGRLLFGGNLSKI
jgi:hypothetical protein